MLVRETQRGEAWCLGRLFSLEMYDKCTACAGVESKRSAQITVRVPSTTHPYEGLGCLDAVISFSSRFGIERRSERVGFTTELAGLSNTFVPFSMYLSSVSYACPVLGAGGCWRHEDELDPVLALKG